MLAQYAARSGARVTALEHDPVCAARTRAALQRMGLADRVDLRLAPLRSVRCADGRARRWYGAEPGHGFDFVLVDGPPMRYGRGAALFALAPLLAGEWDLWLDDAARPHERECIALWRRELGLEPRLADVDGKGQALFRAQPPAATTHALPGLGVGILAGGRPDLLAATLELASVAARRGCWRRPMSAPTSTRPDEASRAVLEEAGVVDRWLACPATEAVGPATSRLALAVAGADGVELYLHLEDDWGVATLDDTWPARAAHPRGGPRGGAGAPAPQRACSRATWSAARRSPGRTRRACCGRARRTSRSTRS